MKGKHSDIKRATNLEEIQSLLDDGYRLIVFENNEDGDRVSMIGNDRATETTRRSFQNRRVTNLREFCALFDEGKPFIILKDDETGLYLKHEIAEIVDGNVKLTVDLLFVVLFNSLGTLPGIALWKIAEKSGLAERA